MKSKLALVHHSSFLVPRYCPVGPEGLEPSLARVRAGCAAANTLIPSFRSRRYDQSHSPLTPGPSPTRGEGRRCARGMGAEGVEPSFRSYKERALTLELRAVLRGFAVSEVEGTRTLTIPLKRRKRYRYATTSNSVDRDVSVSEVAMRT